jgi:hypothetical protein
MTKVALPKPMATGRPCRVCASSRLQEINSALIAGGTPAEVSKRFDIGKQSVTRHWHNHVPNAAAQAGAQAIAAVDASHGATLVQQASELRDKALSLLRQAEADKDWRTALMGVREALRCLETMAKLTGEIDESVHLSITVAPVMIELQTVIMSALGPYPEARGAVILALGNIGSGPPMIEHDRQS